MDAFYAADRAARHSGAPRKPVAVGGSRERGVVAAASYESPESCPVTPFRGKVGGLLGGDRTRQGVRLGHAVSSTMLSYIQRLVGAPHDLGQVVFAAGNSQTDTDRHESGDVFAADLLGAGTSKILRVPGGVALGSPPPSTPRIPRHRDAPPGPRFPARTSAARRLLPPAPCRRIRARTCH